jgi:hypothetical protein
MPPQDAHPILNFKGGSSCQKDGDHLHAASFTGNVEGGFPPLKTNEKAISSPGHSLSLGLQYLRQLLGANEPQPPRKQGAEETFHWSYLGLQYRHQLPAAQRLLSDSRRHKRCGEDSFPSEDKHTLIEITRARSSPSHDIRYSLQLPTADRSHLSHSLRKHSAGQRIPSKTVSVISCG